MLCAGGSDVCELTGSSTNLTAVMSPITLSILIPCLNEADTIEECVTRARMVLDDNGIDGEVIVVDNDSDDGSADACAIRRRHGGA